MRGALVALTVSTLLMSSAGKAQDLTDQELIFLFQAQRDAFLAAKSGNTSLTRGLTLVTADDVTVTTEAPVEVAAEDDAAEVTADPVGSTVVVGTDVARVPDTEVVAVASTGPTILVKVPQDLQVNVRIKFDFDSAALTPDQTPKLQQLCNVMHEADIQLFRIVGHTDASGSAGYNERLSLLRAQEVQRFLINDCGISPSRLEAVGLGKRFLIEGADPNAEENRRVEFQALS